MIIYLYKIILCKNLSPDYLHLTMGIPISSLDGCLGFPHPDTLTSYCSEQPRSGGLLLALRWQDNLINFMTWKLLQCEHMLL